MPTTNVPSITFNQEGIALPHESEILKGVLTDIDSAFGGGLNPALETPQGQLASSTAAIIGNKNSEFAFYVNQIDPAFADGRMQEAIGRIYFLSRKPGTATTVTATCSGLTGVVIPAGARAQSTDGNIYVCNQTGVIGASGSVDLPFSCTVIGPVSCTTGMLNQIYQAIPGWDAINNSSSGVLGSNVESRAEFETRRRQSVALNSRGSVSAIYASVANVDGVIDLYVTENNKSTPQVISGVTLLPHSIWVAVTGGSAEDIARAIWRKKSNGANYNGNTVFIVEDKDGYAFPYPSYEVRWETPKSLPILFDVKVASNPMLPSDVTAKVKDAIISAFNGADGGDRARIGSTIYASRFYAALSAISPVLSILSLNIGDVMPDAASITVPIDRQPVIEARNITVNLL